MFKKIGIFYILILGLVFSNTNVEQKANIIDKEGVIQSNERDGCEEGYVDDCSEDGDCCPESWIGDGWADCEDQAYECDLSCYDDDGGDCSGEDNGDNDDWGDWTPCNELTAEECAEVDYCELNDSGECDFAQGGGGDWDDWGDWGDWTPCNELTAEECAEVDYCELNDAGECVGNWGFGNCGDGSLEWGFGDWDWDGNGYLIGDINIDQSINVIDIINQVNFVINIMIPNDYEFWASDMNIDEFIDVLDVVSLVNNVLGLAYHNSHSEANATINGNELSTTGSIGGIQFNGELVSNLIGNDIIASNNGIVIIYNMNGVLDTKSFTFTSEAINVIVSSSNGEEIPLNSIAPINIKLNDSYPNPFNPSTTISFSIENSSNVNLSIYNIVGQKVEELVNANKSAGDYNITWNASNQPSGLYFVMLSAGSQTVSQKITLIK